MIKIALDNKAVKEVQKAIGGGSDNPDGTVVVKIENAKDDNPCSYILNTEKLKQYCVEEWGNEILNYEVQSPGTDPTFNILVTDNDSLSEEDYFYTYKYQRDNCDLINCCLFGDGFSGVFLFNESFGDPYNPPSIESYSIGDILEVLSDYYISPSYVEYKVQNKYFAVVPTTITLYLSFYADDYTNAYKLKKTISLEEALSLIIPVEQGE